MTTPAYLYHGALALVDRLEPRRARGGVAADQLTAVYASHRPTFAMAFGLPIVPDAEGKFSWSLQYGNQAPRIAIHGGSLRLDDVGYLYRVPVDTFVRIDALQWVSTEPVTPADYEVIHPSEWVHWIDSSAEAPIRVPRTRDRVEMISEQQHSDANGRAAVPPRRKTRIDFDNLRNHMCRQFRLPLDSIHGPDHWRRVERNGLRIARHTGADVDVVRLFAIFHDCCRENDFFDEGHGARGADYAASLRSALFDVPEEAFELLRVACSSHTRGRIHSSPTIGTCWDADRLDLTRVGVAPNARFMSTGFGRAIADRCASRSARSSTGRNGGRTVAP